MTQRNFITTPVLITVFVGMVVSSIGYSRNQTVLPETVSTLPSARAIRALDFGLHTATASLVWLKINQGVYTWLDSTKKYERFSKEIEIVTNLDPGWGFPYAFGTLLLPGLGKNSEAIALGEKGIRNVPNDWRIPYYMAMVYNGNIKDRANAAKYFSMAATTPNAPENVKRAALAYGTQKNQLDEMEIIWRTLYENADNEILRTQAEKYLLIIEELRKKEVLVK